MILSTIPYFHVTFRVRIFLRQSNNSKRTRFRSRNMIFLRSKENRGTRFLDSDSPWPVSRNPTYENCLDWLGRRRRTNCSITRPIARPGFREKAGRSINAITQWETPATPSGTDGPCLTRWLANQWNLDNAIFYYTVELRLSDSTV